MSDPPAMISAPRVCPKCGAEIPSDAPEGGCTFCLLQAAIGSEQETVQDSTPDGLKGGMRFGVYEIDCHADGSLCELGRGAMGVTYRATDTTLQRKVALKIIKTDLAERNADARERFMREARAAAALRHENIATIHQFGMSLETGQYFYAMELIEGETLDERVHRVGPLDARSTIEIARQVTSALADAEEHGLVHRDLKPANLMLVSPSGKTTSNKGLLVKIIDFGLAKAIHAQADPKSLTHERFVGTPAFASPEQFEHSALDVRSDIYSLGGTLWFALTGTTPFAGRSVDDVHRAQQSNTLRIEQLKAAQVPHRLRSLLESMLAFEPASRPGTRELAARLRRCSPEARNVQRTRLALAASLIALVVAAGWIVWKSEFIHHPVTNGVAVLPFENLSGDPDNAYFASGIQDEILTRLVSIAGLKVISRTSTQEYQSKPRNLREIAKQLGIAYFLEGSVQKAGDAVRVNVQLIKGANDSHLWADTFDRKLTDIFGVESEIAKRIAESLQAKLTGREEQVLAIKPTNNPEAYDAYLHAVAIDSTESIEASKRIADLYAEAVRLDPQFALAWAHLAVARSHLYFNGVDLDKNSGAAVKEAADRAMSLQPELGEAWLAQGVYRYRVLRDFQAALQSYEEGLRRLPNSAFVLEQMAHLERRLGRADIALKHYQAAAQLDPRNTGILLTLADTLQTASRYDEAQTVFDRALEISPGNDIALALKALSFQAQGRLNEAAETLAKAPANSQNDVLAFARASQFYYERRFDEAIAQIQQNASAEFVNDPRALVLLGLCQKLSGKNDEARATFTRALAAIKPTPDSVVVVDARNLPIHLAWVYAGLGEKEKALDQARQAITDYDNDALVKPFAEIGLATVLAQTGDIESAIAALPHLLEEPNGLTVGNLRIDPVWDPLRKDPRFQKLCEEKQP